MKNSIDEKLHRIKKRKNNISRLYLDVGESTPEADFSFETFNINFSLDPVKKILNKLKNIAIDYEEEAKKNPERMIKTDFDDPLVLHFSKILQVSSHEMFHLYQNINSDILYCYAESSISSIKAKSKIILEVIASDFKYKKGQEILSEEVLDVLNISSSTKEYIDYTLNLLDETSGYIDYSIDNLSIFDLIEGAAFNFQLVATKDSDCEAFPIIKNIPIYNKAYEKFLLESKLKLNNKIDIGLSRIIFLIISTFSILCSDVDSKRSIPMFINLSRKSQVFFDKLSSINLEEENRFGSPIWGSFISNKFSINKNKYTPSYRHMPDNEEDKINLHKITKKIKKENKKLYFLMCDFVDDVIDEINSIDYEFLEKPMIFDAKFKAINKFINREYPTFNTYYFIPLLMSNISLLSEYSILFSDIQRVEYEVEGMSDYSVEIDYEVINIIEKIENLLDENEYSLVQCCEEHGLTKDVKTIVNCSNNYSFNKMFKLIFNVNLSNIIEV